MCGIGGSWSYGSAVAENIELFLTKLAHRGPDGHGIYYDHENGIGLAHTRLAILDLSDQASQPMVTDDGSQIIVFNGEIYNFEKLRDELQLSPGSISSRSDTEILLLLYKKYGVNFLRRLRGMFAFAIWDRKLQQLFLARDRQGIKPLYYSDDGKRFVFSSEISAIPGISRNVHSIDPVSLCRHLSFLWCPGRRSIAKGIFKILPGEAMIVSLNGKKKQWRWASDHPIEARRRIETLGKHDLFKTIEELIGQAVHRELTADVPIGSFLSGGLDSSTVVHFAKKHLDKLPCFTLASNKDFVDEGFADDFFFAKKMAKYFDLPLEVIEVDNNSIGNELERFLSEADEPVTDPASINNLYICQRASALGIKVLLSGTGGDDIFTGYRRHQALLMTRYWRYLPATVRNAITNSSQKLSPRSSLLRRANKFLSAQSTSVNDMILAYFRWHSSDLVQSVLDGEFKQSATVNSIASPLRFELDFIQNGMDDIDKCLRLEQRFYLPDHNLLYTDKTSMRAGIEVRVPFLDVDLVDFVNAVPSSLKIKLFENKSILKNIMKRYLPREVINRPKSGFGAPLRTWIHQGSCAELMLDVFNSRRFREQGIFDQAAVLDLYFKDKNRAVDASYLLFAILGVELWRHH